jgi:hypothetical protein
VTGIDHGAALPGYSATGALLGTGMTFMGRAGMARWLAIAWLVAAVLGGGACSLQRRSADRAFTRGDYYEAAAQYHQLLEEQPGDAELTSRRVEAATRGHAKQLAVVLRVRSQGQLDETIAQLSRLLRARQQWTPGRARSARRGWTRR